MKYYIILIIFFIAGFNLSYSQSISVNPAIKVFDENAVESLNNKHTGIEYLQFFGKINSYATFNASGTTFPLERGILLTTGNAFDAVGPNDSEAISTDNSKLGGTTLSNFYSGPVWDASSCNFRFVSCDTVYSLSFVYASDEYPEYEGYYLADVCGIFIWGPKPFGGNYTQQNVALLPGSSSFVGAYTVNSISNVQYFNSNGNGTTPSNEAIQYDGYTDVITISIPVVPNETYFVSASIGELVDREIDSGLFFCVKDQNNSKRNFIVDVESAYGGNGEFFEDYPAWFHLSRSDSTFLSSPMIVYVEVDTLSIASPVIDIIIPDSLVLPSGAMSYNYPISILADTLVEPSEDLILKFYDSCIHGYQPMTITINDVYELNAGINLDTFMICDGSPISVHTYANAADSMLTFNWSNGSTADSISFTGNTPISGIYSVTIAHVDGYFETDSIWVSISPIMDILLTHLHDSCSYDAIDLAITGGVTPYSILWNIGETIEDIGGLTMGTYSVTVTGNLNCTESATLSISGPDPIHSQIIEDIHCSDSICSLYLEIENGSPPYSVLWSTGVSVLFIDSMLAGQYHVTVSDSIGCVHTDSILVNPIPLHIDIDYSTNGCLPSLAKAMLIGGNQPFTYHWWDGSSNSQKLITQAGEYWVEVTDSSGCVVADSFIFVEDTSLFVEISHIIQTDPCSQTPGAIDISVSNGTAPFTYSWSNSESSQNVDSLLPGLYTLTIVDSNLCYANFEFEIPEFPPLSVFLDSMDIYDCVNLNNGFAGVEIIASNPPVNYLWSNGSTESFITGLTPGYYSFTVSDLCDQIIDSVTLSYQYPVSHFLSVTDAYCSDSTGKVIVSMGQEEYLDSIYIQSINSNTFLSPIHDSLFQFLPSDSYQLAIVDTFGCVATDSFMIQYLPNTLYATISTAYCPGYPINGNASFLTHPNSVPGLYYDIQFPSFNPDSLIEGTPVTTQWQDDKYWGPFPIGFDFAFFGDTVNEFYAGSNGWISFSPLSNSGLDPWSTEPLPNPDPARPRNAILALYRDWNPEISGSISYYVTGNAPLRKLVVNYLDISLYSCTAKHGNFQIVLYESSGLIDVNIIDGPVCHLWGYGYGVSGIQNADGTIAYVLDSLNETPFYAKNYCLRYNPLNPLWFDPSGNLIETGNNITFNADTTGIFTCESYTNCGIEIVGIDVQYAYDFVLDIGDDTLLCPNESCMLQLPQNILGYWSTGILDSALHITEPGEYSVQISLADSFCNWFDTISVNYEELVFFPGFDTTICQDDTIIVDFNPGFNYQWSNGSGNNWLSVSGTSTYQVTVSTSNCELEDTVELYINFYPLPISILPTDTTKCPNQNLSLDGGNYPFYDYSWSNGYNNDYSIIDSVGLYTLTLTDTLGCITVDSVWVTNQLPVSSAFNFFEAFNHVNFINQSQNAYYYFWDFGDGSPISIEANPEHDYPVLNQNMWYTATLVSANQCGSDTSTLQIFTFDIEEMDGEFPIQIYPNPNKGNFYLSGRLESKDDLNLHIFNSTGQEIYRKEISSKEGKLSEEIGLGKVVPGIYFLMVQQKEMKWVWKMVVE
ncbi:MAG: choice-of-anchor L domain-containing protein [Bacteroidales bacterium]|nr:choice-of-anchor L domain-containing protein [Bacteroidales bacterium]MCF8455216.1 choice-of-anchor L domain-containing protein [Bacteroidales bacterium]